MPFSSSELRRWQRTAKLKTCPYKRCHKCGLWYFVRVFARHVKACEGEKTRKAYGYE